ncbi:hypothetical protein [Isoptericola sp. G70]|uniref:hypothetical protein n=1 Tax=Isoptericola sp. G70 TaxID=3376633 RepID=UPI003A7FBC40
MTTGTASRERRRRAQVVAAAVGVVALLGVAAASSSWTGGDDPDDVGGAVLADAAVSGTAPAVRGPVPVCGFGDLAQVTDDGVVDEELDGLAVAVPDVTPVGGATLIDFQVRGGTAYVLSFDGDSTYRVDRYDAVDGSAAGGFDVPLRLDDGYESFTTGDFQVDDEGYVYLLDTLMGRRDLLRIGPEGERDWTATLPPSTESRGDLLDLYGTVLLSEDEGVVGVHEGSAGMHQIAADGTVLGFDDAFPGGVEGVLDDGAVVLAQNDGSRLELRGRTRDGATTFALGGEDGPDGLGRGGQYLPRSMDGVVSGPGGEGLLVAVDQLGLEWYSPDGARLGVWPVSRGDLDHELLLDARAGVARDDDASYLLAGTQDGTSLVRVSDGRMRYQLTAPVKYNAGTDSFLSVMGMGLGLTTPAEYGYFGPGDEPAVSLSVDDAWAPVSDRYVVRYQVRGDPRLRDPVASEWQQVELPADGGEVALALPDARAGVYEVDAHLVDVGTDEAVSGDCLRYTVGPDGADLDLASMADGAGWGGASPLRGVQLADALGFGSHRVQLDVAALVPDPTAEPSRDGLEWGSLPSEGVRSAEGEAPSDPFTELRRASELADELGVRLVVQLDSGGGAEHAAVEAGTWEGWVREIVAEVSRQAPGIVHWEPWNEPNATGFDDGGDYVRDVAAPFARGAREANPDVLVVGGNSLGVALDWWEGVVGAGGCDTMDVVGIHPYTGLNRSWEEEGFSEPGRELDELREILEPCGDLPWWDTETGWWSDGVVNFWAGGSDVARKLLWYRLEGIEEWTYFFSEGGWGETGNSWSAIQHDGYVKPLGAAAAATTHLLDQYAELELLDAPAPGTYAVRGTGEGGELLALWTDDLASTLTLAAPGGAQVELVDQYGARRPLDVPADGVALPVGGAPAFVVAPPGTGLTAAASEPYGEDVLEGRPVRASSTHEDADAAAITSGTFNVRDPWRSGRLADGSVDENPTVTVRTADPVEIDRIAVATAGIRCCTAGLRDYTVEVRDAAGDWQVVGEVTGQLFDRVAMLQLDPVTVTGVRVSVPMTTEREVPVLDLNYSGVVGGPHPAFMELVTESDYQVAISAVRAWGPS